MPPTPAAQLKEHARKTLGPGWQQDLAALCLNQTGGRTGNPEQLTIHEDACVWYDLTHPDRLPAIRTRVAAWQGEQ